MTLLTDRFIRLHAEKLAHENVVAIREQLNMREVVHLLNEQNCGCVVVESGSDEILGIITERDVLLKTVDWDKNVAADIMTPNPQVIRKTGSIARALHIMSVGGFRHLPVVYRKKFVEGILSVKDVVKAIYGTLMKHHIGEKCDAIGKLTSVQKYFCSTLDIFQLPPPVLVSDDASLHDALQELKKSRSGAICLVDGDQKLKGIFTDRDFIHDIAGEPLKRTQIPIASYMTPSPITVKSTDTVYGAYELLSQKGFRHLPLVNGDSVVAILSIKDFLDVLVQEIIEQLEGV